MRSAVATYLVNNLPEHPSLSPFPLLMDEAAHLVNLENSNGTERQLMRAEKYGPD